MLVGWVFALLSCTAWGQKQMGMTANEIRIGQSAILSGPVGAFTQDYIDGAQLMFDKVNTQGGIHARKIVIKIKDNAFNAEKGAQTARELIEQDDVFLLFGTGGTGPSSQLINIAAERKVPVFAPYTGADSLRTLPGDNIFLRATYSDEVKAAIKHFSTIGWRKVAVVYQDDAYGKPIAESARNALKQINIEPVADLAVAATTKDFSQITQRLGASQPDVTLLILAGTRAVDALQAIYAKGLKTQIYSNSVINTSALIQSFGPQLSGMMLSQVVPNPGRPNLPITREYRNHLNQFNQIRRASYAHFEGYLSARVLVTMLQNCGPTCTREKFLATIRSTATLNIGGLIYSFNKSNNGMQLVDLTIFDRNGQLKD
jgi:branched-chain amino acid transport system substrate-binding protein